MSRPVDYEKKKVSRARKPAAFTITRLQYAELHLEKNVPLYVKIDGYISKFDAKRMRNWLTSYLQWERKRGGE